MKRLVRSGQQRRLWTAPWQTQDQGGAQSRFGWSWAGFRLLAQAEDGEQERRVVADLP